MKKKMVLNTKMYHRGTTLDILIPTFKSRSLITTQRAFNSLKIEDGVVVEISSPPRKIEAEAN